MTVPTTLKRRAHRKSRTGCAECKRRRIKCDEAKPRCANCARYDVSCIYPRHGTVTLSVASATQSSFQSPSSRQLSQGLHSPTLPQPSVQPKSSASTPGSKFGLKDLALLHYWTLVTSKSIINSPDQDYFWQTVFPEIACHHDYVMHAILSLAALHETYQDPLNQQSSLYEAELHHTKALQGFREAINDIGSHNADALFTSAVLSFIYAFTTFGKLRSAQDGETLSFSARTSRVLGTEWIPLARGVKTILEPVYEHVRKGPLCPILSIENWDELDVETHVSGSDAYMLRLREIWEGDENAEVYDQTVHLLRKCAAWMSQFQIQGPQQEGSKWGYNRAWSGPFIWLALSPERYFVLQQQRQPAALVLFAYFGVLLLQLEAYWWMEGCGKSIIGVVSECLGPYWSPYMEWPKQMGGLG